MNQLSQTLTDALTLLGCDPTRFDFDTHSAVVMQFADVGELILEPDEQYPSLWSRLDTSPQQRFNHRAEDLLALLSEPVGFMANGCLALRQLEDVCAVGGVLHADCVSSGMHLAEALQSFYTRVGQMQAVLR
ncbi:hypothetical protein [uncultured Stenotrophomonas sp.]|uniref:InvB/SpaK family type III secretion system chaperone n=1 Tax=uncultured Stenotrophomonas sp. TaxID=165438 RepID=UPI0025D92DFB|nr:hypothetical protein [uncultured Stenotrophomonas sp.]